MTAEKMFANRQGLTVKSAGIASTARIRISPKLIRWADLVFVMENRHKEYLLSNFGDLINLSRVVCLDLPSGYRYNDPELIELIETGIKGYF